MLESTGWKVTSCLGMLLLGAWILFTRLPAAALGGIAIVAALGVTYLGWNARLGDQGLTLTQQCVFIDSGHIQKTGHYSSKWNVDSGLTNACLRAGLIPIEGQDTSSIGAAGLFVSIAPSKPFTSSESATLIQYMHGGGTTLFALDHESSKNVDVILDRLGVRVSAEALGVLPDRSQLLPGEELAPRSLDAYQLEVTNTGAEVLFAYRGKIIIASLPVGAGRAIVIGDPKFFSMSNIEGRWGYHKGNLKLLYYIFEEYLGGAKYDTKPLFNSPRKPS